MKGYLDSFVYQQIEIINNEKEKSNWKRKLTVGLEPTTSGLEVQCAIQLRHASSCLEYTSLTFQHPNKPSSKRIVIADWQYGQFPYRVLKDCFVVGLDRSISNKQL